ncbi:MAG: carbohydrate kinase [Cyanobacteria bacterium J06638_28]
MAKGIVVCLGEILIDQVVDVNGNRQNFPGGAPANVATALARFNIATEFIGGVSHDTHGQNLIAFLSKAGVGSRGIQQLQQPTRIVEVFCDSSGERTFGGFLGDNNHTSFADAHLAADILPISLLKEATALVVGTLGLASPETRLAMIQSADLIQAEGGQMIVDVNWRPTFWQEPNTAITVIEPWLKRADWLKLSIEDANDLLGTTELTDLTQRFPHAQGILLTDGERGCEYYIAGKGGRVPAFPVASIDTTGAGDAFLAGFIYQLFRRCVFSSLRHRVA